MQFDAEQADRSPGFERVRERIARGGPGAYRQQPGIGRVDEPGLALQYAGPWIARGIDRAGTDRALRRSVELARAAAAAYDGPRWVAASVGPYGAALADGQEYTGDYDLSVAHLREWHRPRLTTLVDAGPAEGKARDAWTLRSAAELLDLKICDMAMGSGAFLGQLVTRYLESFN